MQIHDSCDKFAKCRVQTRYNPLLKYTLNSLLTEISEVRNIMEAEKEEFGE